MRERKCGISAVAPSPFRITSIRNHRKLQHPLTVHPWHLLRGGYSFETT